MPVALLSKKLFIGNRETGLCISMVWMD